MKAPTRISAALRIAVIYALFGAIWILATDRLVLALVFSRELMVQIAIYKGWFYVLVTATLLYWLIRRSLAEQERIAQILAKNEEKYRTILDQATDAIFVCDFQGRFLDVNRQACLSLGFSREELLALRVPDLDGTCGTLADCQKLWSQLTPSHTLTIESNHRRKDGSFFPVEIHIGLLVVDRETLVLGIARDISERRQARQAMEQAAAEWSVAMDALDDAIYLVDAKRRLRRANQSFYRLLGKRPEEAVGVHIAALLHAREEVGESCPVCGAQEEKRDGVFLLEAEQPHNPYGLPAEVSVKMIRDQRGEPFSMLVSIHDLTRSREALSEKARLESLLAQAQKMEAIGTLAGGIAHDFNNILTAILGYSDLLKTELGQGKFSRTAIEEVIKATYRARDLVTQILTFSRKGERKIVPIRPHLLVLESLKLLRASIPSTVDIQTEIDSECGAILLDPSNLHQVMMNLCTNALHAMANEQGVLRVGLHRVELQAAEVEHELGVAPGPFVELRVSDSGCGMDDATLARIFEPYFTTKEFGKGTGIGLALVHGIVYGCGGLIKVESHLGQGSVFHLYFPAIAAVTPPLELPAEAVATGSERILVVDDEQSIVEFEKLVLEHLGYKVTTATNSVEAFALFQANPEGFDLVVTDQTMPLLPGTELTAKIIALRPGMPIILCSGYSSMVDDQVAKTIGVKAFVMKPFGKAELGRLVRKVLDER